MRPGTATAPAIFDQSGVLTSLTTSGVQSPALAATTAYFGVCALVLAAPFELTKPLLRLPSQSISNLEALLLIVFMSWSAVIVWSRRWPRLRTPLTGPWVALLAAMLLSTAAAPAEHMNALHMTGRAMAAFGVYLLTVNGITSSARLQRALAAALAAGVAVGVLAVLEYREVGPVLRSLQAFRPDRAAVGSQVRAGGPLQYPTIASMYLEVAFAFGLGLLLAGLDASRPVRVAAVFVVLVLIGDAIILTFTRAGLLAMVAMLALVGLCRYGQRGADRGVALIGALSLAIAAALFTSRSAESIWLRLTSDGQDGWYRFTVDAPAYVELSADQIVTVPVSVTNTGRLTWDSSADSPFYLAYHWLEAESDRVVSFDGLRSRFVRPVAPGTTASVDAQVKAPRQRGRYRLVWDMVQEGRLWFGSEPGVKLTAFSRATVSGSMDRAPALTSQMPTTAVRPGRLALWRAASRMLAAHPLLGVGPDNFRLSYGEHSAIDCADPRVHSNDMYIEMVVGSGLIGGLAFAWLLWRAAGHFASGLRLARDQQLTAALGIAAAGLAIGLHGVVDSFLGFTPTYVLIAVTLGFAVACSRMETQPDANRV